MGAPTPDSPPWIVWPSAGSAEVATDVVVLASGGTIAHVEPSPLVFEHEGGAIEARLELVGHDERATPHGIETFPVLAIHPRVALPAGAEVRLIHRHPVLGPRALVAFRTGAAPGSRPRPPRRVDVPLTPGVPSFAPPAAATGRLAPFAIELGAGPWVLCMRGRATRTVISVGPGVHSDAVELDASGAGHVQVLDARLVEALGFAV